MAQGGLDLDRNIRCFFAGLTKAFCLIKGRLGSSQRCANGYRRTFSNQVWKCPACKLQLPEGKAHDMLRHLQLQHPWKMLGASHAVFLQAFITVAQQQQAELFLATNMPERDGIVLLPLPESGESAADASQPANLCICINAQSEGSQHVWQAAFYMSGRLVLIGGYWSSDCISIRNAAPLACHSEHPQGS